MSCSDWREPSKNKKKIYGRVTKFWNSEFLDLKVINLHEEFLQRESNCLVSSKALVLLATLTSEIKEINNHLNKLEADVTVAKNVNSRLVDQLVEAERHSSTLVVNA